MQFHLFTAFIQVYFQFLTISLSSFNTLTLAISLFSGLFLSCEALFHAFHAPYALLSSQDAYPLCLAKKALFMSSVIILNLLPLVLS